MREFSPTERRIISECLIKGSEINNMFSKELVNDGKLLISIDHSGNKQHKFEFFSDSYDPFHASEELVIIIKLLEYLVEKDMVYKIPSASTILQVDYHLTVGNSASEKSKTFTLLKDGKELVSYWEENNYTTFKATESLKTLVARKFQTPEDIRHNQILEETKHATGLTIAQMKKANWITLGLASVTIVLGLVTSLIQYNSQKFEFIQLDKEYGVLKNKVETQQQENQILKDENNKNKSILDSVQNNVSQIQNSLNNPAKKKR